MVIQVFLQMEIRTRLPINMETLLNSSAALGTHYKGQPFGNVRTTVCGLVPSLPVKVSRRGSVVSKLSLLYLTKTT